MLDTHCHLTFSQFRNQIDRVLQSAAERGVAGVITVSTTTSDVIECIQLARNYPMIWCTAGVHPLNCDEPIDWPMMVSAAADDKCIAWGELGLDNHYDKPLRSLQDKVLFEQLAVVQNSGIDLPVVVHCRKAYAELISILKDSNLHSNKFVFHCFTGNESEARLVLDFGAMISFTGIVTFKNAQDVQAAAKLVPDDRIMIETDSPFLTPEPHRKIRTNEPQYAMDTAKFVAKLRGNDWHEFHNNININTNRFFGIPLESCT